MMLSDEMASLEPERRCEKHIDADEAPYCADCSQQQRIHQKWVDAQAEANAQAERDRELVRQVEEREAKLDAIRACTLCDENGYLTGAYMCDHVDRRETARRGAALVNAELARIRAEKARRR